MLSRGPPFFAGEDLPRVPGHLPTVPIDADRIDVWEIVPSHDVLRNRSLRHASRRLARAIFLAQNGNVVRLSIF
jgi:hypothetical protein